MEVHVSFGRRGRWPHDVYAQLRSAILDGRLRGGDRLPATRALALRLDVSRNALDVVPSGAGRHVAALFRDARRDSDVIVARAHELGVGVSSLRWYHAARPREGLALGFGLIAANQVGEGVVRLASAITAAPAVTSSRHRR
jgi:DNA-binding transcriptional MocR family regulator